MSKTTILLQPRQALAHLERLVELLVVLDEQDLVPESSHRYSTCAAASVG